jgi:hypothetical protein
MYFRFQLHGLLTIFLLSTSCMGQTAGAGRIIQNLMRWAITGQMVGTP